MWPTLDPENTMPPRSQGKSLDRVTKQKHRPTRQNLSKKCPKIVFSAPPDNFWTFFGHFLDIFQTFCRHSLFPGCLTICPLQCYKHGEERPKQQMVPSSCTHTYIGPLNNLSGAGMLSLTLSVLSGRSSRCPKRIAAPLPSSSSSAFPLPLADAPEESLEHVSA